MFGMMHSINGAHRATYRLETFAISYPLGQAFLTSGRSGSRAHACLQSAGVLGLTPFAHTQVVLQGHTSDRIADERVKQAYLGGVK